MRKIILFVLSGIVLGYCGAGIGTKVYEDTIWVDGDVTVYSRVIDLAGGGSRSVLLECFDDSTAGFASDSLDVGVSVYQAFSLNDKDVVLLASKSHPDSTSWPFGSVFVLDDSVKIGDCDTGKVYVRTMQRDTSFQGDVISTSYTDDLDSTIATRGAFVYWPLSPDVSDGVVFEFDGHADTQDKGLGARFILRIFQDKDADR